MALIFTYKASTYANKINKSISIPIAKFGLVILFFPLICLLFNSTKLKDIIFFFSFPNEYCCSLYNNIILLGFRYVKTYIFEICL